MYIGSNRNKYSPAFMHLDKDDDPAPVVVDPKESDISTESKDKGKTFTQDDVSRISAKEKRLGKESATNALLESLGVDNVEDAKAKLAKLGELEEAQKTDDEKKDEALTAAELRAEEAEKESKRKDDQIQNLKIKQEVFNKLRDNSDIAVKPSAFNDVWSFIKNDQIEKIKVEGDEISGIDEAIAAVTEKREYLLETEPKQPGTPKLNKKAPKKNETPSERKSIRELNAERRAKKSRSL